MATKKVSIGVSARIRPILSWESEEQCIEMDTEKGMIGIQNNKDKEQTDFYKFNKEIFGQNEDNNDVFNRLCKPLCDNVLNGSGYNSLLITYGQTGSGKTHTLFGSDDDEGVLPKMINYLQAKSDSVSLSAIECYGIRQTKIHFFDLLNVQKCGSKDWDKKARTSLVSLIQKDSVWGVSCIKISDDLNHQKSAINLIKSAMANAHFAQTAKNPHSSRGHILFVATIYKNNAYHRVMVLDLAGSEGISALPKGFAEKVGFDQYKMRLMEAGIINNGLGAMQKMLKEISSKKGLSKVRGDGIRKLLHPFLMKRCNPMIDILFTFSPSISNLDSSRITFRISKIIGNMKIIPMKIKEKQQQMPTKQMIKDKDSIIEKLQNEKDEFEKRLNEKDLLIRQLESELQQNSQNQMNDDELGFSQNDLALHAKDFIIECQQHELHSLKEEALCKRASDEHTISSCEFDDWTDWSSFDDNAFSEYVDAKRQLENYLFYI